MSIPKSIAIGLVKAQAYARGVEKNGQNKQGTGYAYATSEDMIVEGRKSLLEGGKIAFSVTGWTFEALGDTGPARTKTGTDGKVKTLATATGRIRVKYLLVSLDGGEAFEGETSAPIVPEFGRPDDKAEYGALTQCHAYTLRGLLNLPRGLSGEVNMDLRDDERAPEPAEDRAPAQRSPEPDRPAVPPSQVRAAADHAVASQVRGTPADVPTFDPAHVALCTDFERQARELNGGDPNPLYNAIDAAKLPEALAKRAFFACFVAAFRGAPSLKTLDEWVDFAAQIKWGPQYAPLLKEESDRADARLAPAAA